MQLSEVIKQLTDIYNAKGDMPVLIYDDKLEDSPSFIISKIVHDKDIHDNTDYISLMVKQEY